MYLRIYLSFVEIYHIYSRESVNETCQIFVNLCDAVSVKTCTHSCKNAYNFLTSKCCSHSNDVYTYIFITLKYSIFIRGKQ